MVLDTDDRDASARGTVDEATLPDGTRRYPRGRDRQIYGLTVTPYDDLYLGLASLYDAVSGTMVIELAHSFDGIDWRRESVRRPLIPRGKHDAWDSAMVYYPAVGSPLEIGDGWLIYYHGMNTDHHSRIRSRKDLDEFRAIGAVRMKRDRLIGYKALRSPGELITRAFLWNGDKLFLNVDAAGGEARVVVCDEDGRGLEGFRQADAIAIDEDCVRFPVAFHGGKSMTSLNGRSIRLRIHLERATVFGWESA